MSDKKIWVVRNVKKTEPEAYYPVEGEAWLHAETARVASDFEDVYVVYPMSPEALEEFTYQWYARIDRLGDAISQAERALDSLGY